MDSHAAGDFGHMPEVECGESLRELPRVCNKFIDVRTQENWRALCAPRFGRQLGEGFDDVLRMPTSIVVSPVPGPKGVAQL